MRLRVLAVTLLGLLACGRTGSEGVTGAVSDPASPVPAVDAVVGMGDVDAATPLPDSLSIVDSNREGATGADSDSAAGDLTDGSGDAIVALDSADDVPPLDVLAVSDAALHVDSKYPDEPPDATPDNSDAKPLAPDAGPDSSPKDCPMDWATLPELPAILCNDTECCSNGVLGGPCGWHFCCADPGASTIFSLPSCPAVPPSPPPAPMLQAGPCPALQQYPEPVVPPCKAECWCY